MTPYGYKQMTLTNLWFPVQLSLVVRSTIIPSIQIYMTPTCYNFQDSFLTFNIFNDKTCKKACSFIFRHFFWVILGHRAHGPKKSVNYLIFWVHRLYGPNLPKKWRKINEQAFKLYQNSDRMTSMK